MRFLRVPIALLSLWLVWDTTTSASTLRPREERSEVVQPTGAEAPRIIVKSVRLTDNGDDDGFADPNETVSVYVTLRNVGAMDRAGIVLALSSTGGHVDCIPTSVVSFGTLAAGETREAATPLTFRVTNVNRTAVDVEMTASFEVLVWGDDFDLLADPQAVVLDLDLDANGGGSPMTFTEGFESAGLGSFTTMSLDLNRANYDLSSGLRCQNHQCTTGSCSQWQFCYVGFANAANNAFDWHVHGTGSPDGGRAYLGNQSLHWGMHPGAAGMDTTRLKQLDALRTTDPINLGWIGAPSELSFKHQVGLTDCDYVNCEPPLTVDRGVVHVQLASSTGTAVGTWRKLYPYENLYDSQMTDVYTNNCTFDPMDDGSSEFDVDLPTPVGQRPRGPSTTCAPEFSFARQGAIGFDTVFDPAAIGRATDGPGLQGSRGPGTWVESKFRLDRWRGRRIRLRFLATSIEVDEIVSMEQALGWSQTDADDGWYIDDVQVTNALVTPATVTVDTADRTGLPACSGACSGVTAVLTASPGAPGTPGEVVLLDASDSTAGACPGPLLYRFSEDVSLNGLLFPWYDGWDRVLRSWTDVPTLQVAPGYTSRYGVEVRCPAFPGCGGLDLADVTVPCPDPPTPFPASLHVVGGSIQWGTQPVAADVLIGDLTALRSGGYPVSVMGCAEDQVTSYQHFWSSPSPGVGWYYLLRTGGYAPLCVRSWSTGSPAEQPGPGGNRDSAIPLDPDSCGDL